MLGVPKPVSGMYAVYCGDRVQLRRLEAALAQAHDTIATDDWRAFVRVAGGVSCMVVAFRWLREWSAPQRRALLGEPACERPLVVVTSRDADNARLLKGFLADEVVWLGDVERELWGAVRAAESRSLLIRVADALARSPSLPPILRESLAYACRSETPVRSVSELANAMGRDRRTLWRAWHTAFAGTPPLRLEDALHWLLLLRATGRKSMYESWGSVARAMGVHRHTISRAVVRLTGTTLRELSAAGAPAVAHEVERALLVPLVGDAARGALGGGWRRGESPPRRASTRAPVR